MFTCEVLLYLLFTFAYGRLLKTNSYNKLNGLFYTMVEYKSAKKLHIYKSSLDGRIN